MGWNLQNWGPGAKTSFAVLGPEFTVAPAAALGAVYCADKFFPNQSKWLERIVSEHIVQPHLKWFESRAGSLRLAHERYDQRKREERIRRGEPVEEETVVQSSPKERADIIASVLVKGAIAMGADLAATLLAHHFLSKRLKVYVPKKIAFTEHIVHLGGIAFMAGPLAAKAENVHYRLKHRLQKMGMNEQQADDWGTALPYIVFPGQVAAVASLGLTRALNGRLR